MKGFWPLSVLLLLVHGAALAAPSKADCSNPQSAADSLFVWQQAERYDLENASKCADVASKANAQRSVAQLKQLLDARGLYVPVASLPTAPDHVDEAGLHRVTPVESAPWLVLERDATSSDWKYSRKTMDAVPQLYQDTFSSSALWFQSRLPSVFHTPFLGLFLWQYLMGLVLLVISFAVGQLAKFVLRNQVERGLKRLGLVLDHATYQKTNRPVVALVVCWVFLLGLPDLSLPISVSVWAHKVTRIAILTACLMSIMRFIRVGESIALNWASNTSSKLDDQLVPLIRQSLQMLTITIGGLYLADVLGFDVWKLAAGVGIGGLALAYGAQDTVANVFGSLNVFVDKPFQIGDAIKVGSVEGVVEEVGFRSTRLRTYHNSVVTIPNSKITNASVDNLGLRNRRRVKMTLGVTYDTSPDRLQAFVEGLRAILAAHDNVQDTYEVHTVGLGDSAIEILVHYHVVVETWHDELTTRGQNIMEFLRLAEKLGIDFAFPSQSLYVESTPQHRSPPSGTPSLDELQTIVNAFAPDGDLARPGGPEFETSWSVQARKKRDN